LLGLVTALVVARPLVAGEDPGLLLKTPAETAGLVLTLLWLVAAVGWAVWRFQIRQGGGLVGTVEGGLFAVVALVFISAGAASYKHPAWLIASEWLVLLVAFVLVRQLARAPGDNRRLLAALLATGMSLAAQAVYQAAVETRSGKSSPARVPVLPQPGLSKEDADTFGPRLDSPPPRPDLPPPRSGDGVSATFAQPETLGSYLALLVPVAVGGALACRRGLGWGSLLTWAAGSGALLLAVALGLTHNRAAMAACLLVAVAAVSLGLPRRVRWKIGLFLLLVPGPLAVVWLTAGAGGLEKVLGWLNPPLDSWAATWALIRDHPGLGVGPGNFSRWFPRYVPPTAPGQWSDPHNFALEMAAACGWVTLAALLATLGFWFWRVGQAWITPAESKAQGPWSMVQGPKSEERLGTMDHGPWTLDGSGTRWEFYLGGMAGLTLGFVLWVSRLTAEDLSAQILRGGIVAAVRSLVWFGAFALVESYPWDGRGRARSLTAGLAALLLSLTLSGGISFPSVAQPLWVAAALALDALPQPAAGSGRRGWLAAALPLPILGGVCLAYFFFLYYPATRCSAALDDARRHSKGYWAKVGEMEKKQTPEAKRAASRLAEEYLKKFIFDPLRLAANQDPQDSSPDLEWVRWVLEQAKYHAELTQDNRLDKLLDKAKDLDPENKEVYVLEGQVHVLFARRSVAAAEQYKRAAQSFREAVDRAPSEPRLRYHLAEVLYLASDQPAGRREAEKALELDERVPERGRKLTAPQRVRLRQLLAARPPKRG
jgi:hypothetical protein